MTTEQYLIHWKSASKNGEETYLVKPTLADAIAYLNDSLTDDWSSKITLSELYWMFDNTDFPGNLIMDYDLFAKIIPIDILVKKDVILVPYLEKAENSEAFKAKAKPLKPKKITPFTRLYKLSDIGKPLADFLIMRHPNMIEISKIDALREVNKYVKEKNLQIKHSKTDINLDDTLKKLYPEYAAHEMNLKYTTLFGPLAQYFPKIGSF